MHRSGVVALRPTSTVGAAVPLIRLAPIADTGCINLMTSTSRVAHLGAAISAFLRFVFHSSNFYTFCGYSIYLTHADGAL